jgi:hypothetical protein
MLKVISLSAISALALAVTATSQPAFARDGRNGAVAAGVIGGLAVGAIIGSQSNRGYYGGPDYYDESGYQPVYRECHTERQQIEDGYGNVRTRRVRVCD